LAARHLPLEFAWADGRLAPCAVPNLDGRIDGRRAGLDVSVVEDACRGIDAMGSLAKAWFDMDKAGVKKIQSADLAA
jgi:hypothetical protein